MPAVLGPGGNGEEGPVAGNRERAFRTRFKLHYSEL